MLLRPCIRRRIHSAILAPRPSPLAPGSSPQRMSELRLFFTALQFFTRLPVPAWVGYSELQLNASARYFPLVGALVGAIGAAVYWGAAQIFPPAVAVLLAMGTGVWLTGAFHEDGLADTCDGLGGGQTRERALEIMKDSRIGSYAAVGLVLVLLGKAAALAALPAASVPLALIAAHALSRFVALSIMFTQDYVRDDASARAKPMARGIGAGAFVFAGASILPALLPLAWGALGGLALALLFRFWYGRFLQRRLGGYTGDTLGAAQQGSELAFYLGVLGWPGLLAALG